MRIYGTLYVVYQYKWNGWKRRREEMVQKKAFMCASELNAHTHTQQQQQKHLIRSVRLMCVSQALSIDTLTHRLALTMAIQNASVPYVQHALSHCQASAKRAEKATNRTTESKIMEKLE